MYPNLVVASFMIYISSRFEKEIDKTRAISCLAGFVRQLFGRFLSFVFLFLLACGPTWVLGIRGFGGLAGLFCFSSFPLADFNISIFILVR